MSRTSEQAVGVEPYDPGVAHQCVTATLRLLGGLRRDQGSSSAPGGTSGDHSPRRRLRAGARVAVAACAIREDRWARGAGKWRAARSSWAPWAAPVIVISSSIVRRPPRAGRGSGEVGSAGRAGAPSRLVIWIFTIQIMSRDNVDHAMCHPGQRLVRGARNEDGPPGFPGGPHALTLVTSRAWGASRPGHGRTGGDTGETMALFSELPGPRSGACRGSGRALGAGGWLGGHGVHHSRPREVSGRWLSR